MDTQKVKAQIQALISQAVAENEKQKEVLNFLFRKLEEVKELETLERLRDYENGKYLKALLLHQSLIRANYQVEHLKLTNLEDGSKYLEAVQRDIEVFEEGRNKLPREPNATEILKMLELKIKQGEIIRQGGSQIDLHYSLETSDYLANLGEVEVENPQKTAEEFFHKHNVVKSETTKKIA